jgi:hypothetical protein
MSCEDILSVGCCAPCDYYQCMSQLAASPYPQHSFPSSETGQWSSGLFNCFSESDIDALSMCCFPILTARVSNFIASRGRNSERLNPFGLTQFLTSSGALEMGFFAVHSSDRHSEFKVHSASMWPKPLCALAVLLLKKFVTFAGFVVFNFTAASVAEIFTPYMRIKILTFNHICLFEHQILSQTF